jgi:hypothetical protein
LHGLRLNDVFIIGSERPTPPRGVRSRDDWRPGGCGVRRAEQFNLIRRPPLPSVISLHADNAAIAAIAFLAASLLVVSIVGAALARRSSREAGNNARDDQSDEASRAVRAPSR